MLANKPKDYNLQACLSKSNEIRAPSYTGKDSVLCYYGILVFERIEDLKFLKT